MGEIRILLCVLLGLIAGIYIFFYGFNRLRSKRRVEDIPTSTVRGLAMGQVELIGKVRPASVLVSPLSGTECAAYKFKIEEHSPRSNIGEWDIVEEGNSFSCPFYLEDATGKVKVCPTGAEMHWEPDFEFQTDNSKKIPETLRKFLDHRAIDSTCALFIRKMRFTEWCLQDHNSIYVLGTAKLDDAPAKRDEKDRLAHRLSELKKDPLWLKKVDANKDGFISAEEWKAAVARAESELIEQVIDYDNVSPDNAQGIRIAWDEHNQPFIIAREAERELTGDLLRIAILCVWGGPVLSLVSLAYLIFRIQTVFFH